MDVIIKEEFEEGNVVFYDEKFQIFSQPKPSMFDAVSHELSGIRYVRFIASPEKKKLYIFSPKLLHRVAAGSLKLKGGEYGFEHAVWGVAKKVGSKWVMDASDTIAFQSKARRLTEKMEEWKWLTSYIDPSKYLERLRLRGVEPRYDLEPATFRQRGKETKVKQKVDKMKAKNFKKLSKTEKETILTRVRSKIKNTKLQKTAKKLKRITEEFKDMVNVYGVTYSIYKNPTYRDYLHLVRENKKVHYKKGFSHMKSDDHRYVRFIIDKKSDDIYVFSEHLIHQYAADHMSIKYEYGNEKNHFFRSGILNKDFKIKLRNEDKDVISKAKKKGLSKVLKFLT